MGLCTLGDLGAYDDSRHFLLQCPMSQRYRDEMFYELDHIPAVIGN